MCDVEGTEIIMEGIVEESVVYREEYSTLVCLWGSVQKSHVKTVYMLVNGLVCDSRADRHNVSLFTWYILDEFTIGEVGWHFSGPRWLG